MNADWDSEDVLDINHPSIPDVVREHGAIFSNPARFVIDLGSGEYLLYAEDGELLDAVYLSDE